MAGFLHHFALTGCGLRVAVPELSGRVLSPEYNLLLTTRDGRTIGAPPGSLLKVVLGYKFFYVFWFGSGSGSGSGTGFGDCIPALIPPCIPGCFFLNRAALWLFSRVLVS